MVLVWIALGILIPSLWVFLPLKKVPEDIRLSKKTYILTILVGMTIVSILILVIEVFWDKAMHIDPENVKNLKEAFLVSFARAAFIEEFIKYIFVRRALKKHQPQDLLQYMLLAATVGMGYGITEKIVLLDPAAVIVSAFFVGHVIFQFIMGKYLYKAKQDELNGVSSKINHIKALLIPILVHGCWDFALFGTEIFVKDELTVGGVIALLLGLAFIIFIFVYEIRLIIKFKNWND